MEPTKMIQDVKPTITQTFGPIITLVNNSASFTADRILSEIMKYRRTPNVDESCNSKNCPHCRSMYFPKILSAVERNHPVVFVLPAFPGKSPNLEKVLGVLPDYAERLSLQFLGSLCESIKRYYAPGIKIILCSDGRVFSDVVGMREDDVTAYQNELNKIIEELSLKDISTFNLDDHYDGIDFDRNRQDLMNRYGKSLDQLKDKIRKGSSQEGSADEKEANRMYCGMTRFLFEDSMHSNQMKSRASIQKEARAKAYEVIRRSNAWSELIAETFPQAFRLSIHPQTCGSKKLGIRLIGDESWMTPWHGVAVETKEGPILLKRFEAENLGAKLVYTPEGRPSHYQLQTVRMV